MARFAEYGLGNDRSFANASMILAGIAGGLGAAVMSGPGAQANIGGLTLDETQCSAAWAMASPHGDPLNENQAARYVINFIYVHDDSDGNLTESEFKAACHNGLMTRKAVTMTTECTDTHIALMGQLIPMIPDETRRDEATSHLDLSKTALTKGDTPECLKQMGEVHRAMGM
jgi:hypothetical protein